MSIIFAFEIGERVVWHGMFAKVTARTMLSNGIIRYQIVLENSILHYIIEENDLEKTWCIS